MPVLKPRAANQQTSSEAARLNCIFELSRDIRMMARTHDHPEVSLPLVEVADAVVKWRCVSLTGLRQSSVINQFFIHLTGTGHINTWRAIDVLFSAIILLSPD